MVFKIIRAVCGVGVGFSVFLSGYVAAEWKPYISPVELVFEGDDSGNRAYVAFTQKYPLPECVQDGNYVRIYSDSKKGEYFVTSILTAIAAGKQVRVSLSGCDDWGRPVLRGLMIK